MGYAHLSSGPRLARATPVGRAPGALMDDDNFERIIFLADPELNEPVLVYALEGWIDAGLGASTAMSTLLTSIPTETLATFDTEYFIDQRARRPVARIVDGVTTELTWPEIQLRYGRDGDGADMIFLLGPEPDFHWSDFVEAVTDAALRFDVRLVIGLGSFPAPTPHTRPVRVIGTAPEASANLLPLVGTVAGELEVPAGISSALELGFADVDVDVLTLWARVPHYVASMPYPQAAASLIEGLARIAGLTLDASVLRAAADEARLRVDELVTNNPEHTSMVEQLEEVTDESEGNSLGDDVPSGDELAAELEKFLRGEG
ncbi:MAG: PAC2 family protein [Actinomycetota bacterium]|nr:PAC2 family protein [Actinomycetota bacterium]